MVSLLAMDQGGIVFYGQHLFQESSFTHEIARSSTVFTIKENVCSQPDRENTNMTTRYMLAINIPGSQLEKPHGSLDDPH